MAIVYMFRIVVANLYRVAYMNYTYIACVCVVDVGCDHPRVPAVSDFSRGFPNRRK